MTPLEIVLAICLVLAGASAWRWHRLALTWNRDLNWFLTFVGDSFGVKDRELFDVIREHAAQDAEFAHAVRLHWTLKHPHEEPTSMTLRQDARPPRLPKVDGWR